MKNSSSPQFYSSMVRTTLLAAGLVLLVLFPFFNEQGLLPVPVFVSVGAVLILGLLAGVIDPQKPVVMVGNWLVAIVGVLIFSLVAAESYSQQQWLFYFVNQVLACLFFIALYFDTMMVYRYFSRSKSVDLPNNSYKVKRD